ncbi:hypothetical protein B9T62_07800 [Paenibacillus donghaensis]|uniref:Uncharacterized protein n=1 Tax=Paenibacillus donghaensis TaxID=414771 RepID=A0A2Z2KCJ0_9BACL|nr:hypothetical protein B9T62_07800 [Paenibacillus donghaensis]
MNLMDTFKDVLEKTLNVEPDTQRNDERYDQNLTAAMAMARERFIPNMGIRKSKCRVIRLGEFNPW